MIAGFAHRVPSCTGAGTVTLCTRYGRRRRANSKLSGTLIGPTKYLPGTVSPALLVLAVPVPGPAVISAAWLVYCTLAITLLQRAASSRLTGPGWYVHTKRSACVAGRAQARRC